MKAGDYLSELQSFDGVLDAKRYAALLTPIAFFFGALNFIGALIGTIASWKTGGWVVLAAVAGGILKPNPDFDETSTRYWLADRICSNTLRDSANQLRSLHVAIAARFIRDLARA